MKKFPPLACLIALTAEISLSAANNYGEALQKSIYFYQQQRSGFLPANNPVIWRASSGVLDGTDVGKNLTGGYYDAGDHVKFGLPMASTIATLSWGVYEQRSAFTSSGQLDEALDAIKWGTDYFIKCHTAPTEFYYQIGSGSADHTWWGPAEVVEAAMSRPSYKVTAAAPGSTVVGATAAALASASLVFQPTDPAYAALCRDHAIQLFDFAYATQSDAGYSAATGYYDSFNGYWDELACAATWLYLATSDAAYLTKAELCANNWGKEGRRGTVWGYKWTHSWDDMHYMTQLLLARATGKQIYIDSVERNLDWLQTGGGVTYTVGGLAWVDSWGSLRYAANAAFIAFVWADSPLGTAGKKAAYRTFAENQINYILGANPRASSYLIGYGVNSPKNPHHRTAHGSWYNDIKAPANNEHTLFGALVGGPDSKDVYTDDRTNFVFNEVACDYNAALVGALAKMTGLYGGTPLADFPQNYFEPPAQRRDGYFVRARLLAESATSTQIVAQLSNRSTWPATVETELSFAYFFDISEALATGYTANNITATLGQSEGATLTGPFPFSGNVYFVLVSFLNQPIFPGGRAECERMATITLSAPTDAAWDSANDWSRQGLVDSPFTYEPVDLTGKTPFIPVYDAGVRLSGQEPTGTPPPPPPSVIAHVSAIDMAISSAGGAFYQAKATVTIVDAGGAPVVGATVSGNFSGATSGAVSGTTDASGKVVLTSPKYRAKTGTTWTLTVTGVSKASLTYDAAGNVETSDTITF